MSNVVDFFQRVGEDARLRHATAAELGLAIQSERLDPDLCAAIVAKDQSRLDELLGTGFLCAFMVPAKEDEEEGEGEDEGEDTRETPARDVGASTNMPAFRVLTKAS